MVLALRHLKFYILYSFTLSMSDDMRIYLFAQTSLRIVADMSFLVLYLIRIYKLDRMASNNFHSKPKLMKFKIILLVALQIIFGTHVVLSYADESYWAYPYANYALTSVAEIVICLLQIYIIRKQHKKKALKAASIPFLWILWVLFDIATIIYVQVKIATADIILLIFEVIASIALVVVGCFLEQKNESNQEIINAINSPLIAQNRKNSQMNSDLGSQMHDENKIYIEFNKEFNIFMKDNHQMSYQFKFAVFIAEESIVMTRKQQEFTHLATQMQRTFPLCQQLYLPQNKKQSFSNMKRYGEEKQKVYQAYLIKIAQNQKYYTPFLLDFLEVSPLNRIKLTKKKEKQIFHKKDSLNSQEDQKNKKPFFRVEFVNGKIHVSNPDILEVIVNKSKTEIQKFHNKLISEKKLKMELLNQDPDINQLVHFIFRVVNCKNLWKSFSEWLVLGRQLEQKIYNMSDFWNYGFKSIRISIIGYQIAFDRERSVHSLYLVSLSQRKKSSNMLEQPSQTILKEDVTLKKRFNDFVKLDKNIRRFINSDGSREQSLMSLPPKFSPFGTKTSPKSRQIYLDMYLNQVLKLQQINHCVKLLQFLQVDLGRFKQQFHTVDEQNLARERISSMIIDSLQDHI